MSFLVSAKRMTGELVGREVRAAYVAARAWQLSIQLGENAKRIRLGLNKGFPETKGPWTSDPYKGKRVGNLGGPGATYIFASQKAGEQSFLGFNNPEGSSRNAGYTEGKVYDRLGHAPTVEDVETRIVGMVEGPFDKIEAVALSTGQAANVMALKICTAVGVSKETETGLAETGTVLTPAELNRGRHGIIAPKFGMYGCTYDHVRELAEHEGRDVHLIDFTDFDGSKSYLDAIRDRLRTNPHIKVIFLEGLNNPNVTLVDLKEVAKIRNEINQERGVENDVKLVVDLTFTSTQIRPFAWEEELWPDLVTYSATKLIAGGTNMAGFIVGKKELIRGGRSALALKKDTGAIMNDAVAEDLLEGGLRTLIERSMISQHNAWAFARNFEYDDRVEIVYPGLANHPQHTLARQTMLDYDGAFAPSHMIRIRLNPPKSSDPASFGKRFAAEVVDSIITQPLSPLATRLGLGLNYAVSLGNDRHLFSQPVSTTQIVIALSGSKVLPEQLLCGPLDLRFSLGLGPVHIPIAQFRGALNRVFGRYRS